MWRALGLCKQVIAAAQAAQWIVPLPLQQKVLRLLAKKTHCLIESPTYTGKTSAALLAIADHCLTSVGGRGLKAIILVPRRDLAWHCAAELSRLMPSAKRFIHVLLRQQHWRRRARALYYRGNVLITTPASLAALLQVYPLRTQHTSLCLLEAGDELIASQQMPYLYQLSQILRSCPRVLVNARCLTLAQKSILQRLLPNLTQFRVVAESAMVRPQLTTLSAVQKWAHHYHSYCRVIDVSSVAQAVIVTAALQAHHEVFCSVTKRGLMRELLQKIHLGQPIVVIVLHQQLNGMHFPAHVKQMQWQPESRELLSYH